MYYAIFILPNSGDAWETASPFSTLLGSGHLGFCFSNQITSSLSQYTLISNKLLDVSDIDRSVDIFGGSSSEIKGGVSINGIGGVATSSDFSFTIERSRVDPLKLLGRIIKVTFDIINANISDIGASGVNDVFTGKIRQAKPSRQSIEFSCSGLLAMLREKEVGTLSNCASDVYKSKITPIVYGDFTDENAMVEVILDNNVKNNPAIIIDSQPMTSIDNVCIFDVDTKTKINYNNGNITNLKITDNKKIDIVIDNGLILRDAVSAAYDTGHDYYTINIYDPPIIAIETTDDLSTLVAGTTGELLNTVSFYNDNSDTNIIMEYLGVRDGFHIFSCPNIRPACATWVKYGAGPGPATITPTWVSEIIDPVLVLEQTSRVTGTPDSLSGGEPKELVLQISNELMLVYDTSISHVDYLYKYTKYFVSRGYRDSTKVMHPSGISIYTTGVSGHSTWKFEHTLWCSGVVISTELEKSILHSVNLDQLTYMHRIGELGSAIELSHVIPSATIDYDSVLFNLTFPKLNIKGSIINAYILGYYETDPGSGNPSVSYISINQSGVEIHPVLLYSGDDAYLPFTILGGGMGRPIRLTDNSSIQKFIFPQYLNKTPSILALSIDSPTATSGVMKFCNVLPEGEASTFLNCELKTYSLVNKIEQAGNIYYRDFSLGDINSFLSRSVILKWDTEFVPRVVGGIQQPTSVSLSLANPGLLLEMEVNPLESKIYVQGVGRNSLLCPQDILIDILDKELSFTNVSDQTVDRETWKASVNLANDIVKFGDLAQSICEQGGLILSELTDGYLVIHDLTPPVDTSTLTVIHDSEVLLENNMSAVEEEWTTIDRLITDLTVSYAYNAAGEYYSATTEAAGIASKLLEAHAILDEDRKATLQLPYVRDNATVVELSNLVTNYNTTPLKILTVKLIPTMHGLSIGQWVICNVVGLDQNKIHLIVGYNLNLQGIVTVKLLGMYATDTEYIQDNYTEYGNDNDWQDTTTVYGTDDDILDTY
jgi:hypothetical protein